MTKHETPYPIGTPGQPWGTQERTQWLQRQSKQRDYAQLVVQPLHAILQSAEVAECAALQNYGRLDYHAWGYTDYPLFAAHSRHWQTHKPTLLITGGVHGYETSGVSGALQFLQERMRHYAQQANILILPCISPWGFETINRWTPQALDPNRAFKPDSPVAEAALAMALVQKWITPPAAPLVHIDLHETTDTDHSEFRPAKAARDAVFEAPWKIPDGFYVVADKHRPQLAFQNAIIAAVRQVMPIAPADASGGLIGETLLAPGVIAYDKQGLGLCGGMTGAIYVSTTEVYPDHLRSTPALCNQAQVSALCAGFDFALSPLA